MINEDEIEICLRLDGWVHGVDRQDIDAILEWLGDCGFLNEKGKAFATVYWDYCYYNGKFEG